MLKSLNINNTIETIYQDIILFILLMFFFNTRKNIVSELNLFKGLIDTDIK